MRTSARSRRSVKRGDEQSDRAGDHAVRAQAAQAAGDGGGRQRDLVRQRFGGAAVVALDEVQKGNVEAVEHPAQLAKFWHEVKQKCTQRAKGRLLY